MSGDSKVKLQKGDVVGYVDIDDFKKINDTHGHQVGDDVIDHVMEIGEATMPSRGEFNREYGQGDEFLIHLPDTNKSSATEVLSQFLEDISDSEMDGIEITLSVGITEVETSGENFDRVKNQAEEAMRRAKQWGGNQIQIYPDFEPLETIEVQFGLEDVPGRPDDRILIEKWRTDGQGDLRAETIRNETTGAKYMSKSANTIKSNPDNTEPIRAVVSEISTVNRQGVKLFVNTLLCRRLLILQSGSCGVEEDKGTASAVPDTNDSARCVWVGIGRSGPVGAGSLA